MRFLLIAFFMGFLCISANAQLSTSRLFGTHMVLQRNQEIPVWGQTRKNAKVSVKFNGQVVKVKADDSGHWKARLKSMPAGGPYQMLISSGKENLVYTDVMLGEVWICSGQSNMEFALRNAYSYKPEQKNAPKMNIRQFQVARRISLSPDTTLASGQWTRADTNTVGNFTAVGYFFAKKLSEQLHVTVGLINSNWGGTQVEDWISKDAMLNSPQLGAAAKALPATFDEMRLRIDQQLREYAYRKQPVVNYTAADLATQPGTYFSQWQTGNAPGAWEWMGKLYAYRGEGFMQKTIRLDSFYADKKSVIRLGTTDADLSMYINGKLITGEALASSRQLELPTGTWKGGDNSLLIQLRSPQRNPAWYGIGLNGAGNDLYVQFADTTVNLADNTWHTMPDLSRPYHFDYQPNNSAAMLYNGMINPLIPFAIAGVIWYQGETNTNLAYQYRSSFPLMITDWRARWHDDFPFLFVQLSSFGGFQDSNKGSAWAELREAQTLTLQMPNTAMAVTTDIGDAYNIHPKDKADVGIRLANEALMMAYHLPGFAESPLYNLATFNGNYATVSFTHAESGLVAKDKYGYLKGFEIAGADHKFYYAQATIVDGNKIKVWSSDVAQPVAVRYAWTDAPIDANLFSKEGLPVGPFRSDNWKGITDGNVFN